MDENEDQFQTQFPAGGTGKTERMYNVLMNNMGLLRTRMGQQVFDSTLQAIRMRQEYERRTTIGMAQAIQQKDQAELIANGYWDGSPDTYDTAVRSASQSRWSRILSSFDVPFDASVYGNPPMLPNGKLDEAAAVAMGRTLGKKAAGSLNTDLTSAQRNALAIQEAEDRYTSALESGNKPEAERQKKMLDNLRLFTTPSPLWPGQMDMTVWKGRMSSLRKSISDLRTSITQGKVMDPAKANEQLDQWDKELEALESSHPITVPGAQGPTSGNPSVGSIMVEAFRQWQANKPKTP